MPSKMKWPQSTVIMKPTWCADWWGQGDLNLPPTKPQDAAPRGGFAYHGNHRAGRTIQCCLATSNVLWTRASCNYPLVEASCHFVRYFAWEHCNFWALRAWFKNYMSSCLVKHKQNFFRRGPQPQSTPTTRIYTTPNKVAHCDIRRHMMLMHDTRKTSNTGFHAHCWQRQRSEAPKCNAVTFLWLYLKI